MRIVLLLSLLLQTKAWAQTILPYEVLRQSLLSKDWAGLISAAGKFDDAKLTPEDQSIKNLWLGQAQWQLGQHESADYYLNLSLKNLKHLDPYLYYIKGLNFIDWKKQSEGEWAFQQVLKSNPSRSLKLATLYQLSRLAFEQKKWNSAAFYFGPLLSHWQRVPQFPEVLNLAMQVEIERGRKWNACRIARSIYGQYPTHPVAKNWGLDLHKVSVNGKELGCLASMADFKKRLHRLQWGGEADRARAEILSIMDRFSLTPMVGETLYAQFLIQQGEVEEALKMLLRKGKDRQYDFNYLLLLGRAAARLGESQMAIGFYYRAYKLKPNSSNGKKALYQAAFLSYQFQDYDGASRRFGEFIKKYSSSGLAKEAQWYVAWINYLKGDYIESLVGLNKISPDGKRRHARRNSADRISYWKAMCHLKLGENEKSADLFQSLVTKNALSYYGLAAATRLQEAPLRLAHRTTASQGPAEGSLISPSENPEGAAKEVEDSEEEPSVQADEIEGENPDDEPKIQAENDLDGDENKNFENPQFQLHFNRARDLLVLGFRDWARGELEEIEGRTRSVQHLRKLIRAYESADSFNRSAYIAITTFDLDHVGDLETEKSMWQAGFPKAYDPSVKKYSAQFSVPSELVWSIMKAESQFRSDILSPVGAQGLMQLMPYTARQVSRLTGDGNFENSQLMRPDENIRLGTRYLQRLLQMFSGDTSLVAAAYNAGPHRVESWLSSFGQLQRDEFIEHIPFVETRDYVKKVLRYMFIYQRLYFNGPKQLTFLSQNINVHFEPTHRSQETWDD